MKLCQQKLIIEHNRCYSLALPKIFNFPPCPSPVKLTFNMSDCVEQCPHECSSNSYDLSISYSDYPSRVFHNNLAKQDKTGLYEWAFQINRSSRLDSLDLARASLVKLFVYFDDIKFTQITEAPSITFVDLIANIGGTLGLFIGISLLSFVEIIELVLEIIVVVCVNYKKKKNSKTVCSVS